MTLRLPVHPGDARRELLRDGTEAFRGAVYAVASGAVDIALALGVEKLKDTGYGGLPQRGRGGLNNFYWANISAPGSFAQLAAAYRAKHRVDPKDLKRAMAHISVKSHDNGAKNPKAHLRNSITRGRRAQCADDRRPARPVRLLRRLGRLGVRDRDHARHRARARQEGSRRGESAPARGVERTGSAVRRLGRLLLRHYSAPQRRARYKEADIADPRKRVSMFDVHDCFSVTELVTMEDLGISQEGKAIGDVLDGFYDASARSRVQIDGGLKCFGHPIGASG
jgi:acetyl-CoA C-acetyltransferase